MGVGVGAAAPGEGFFPTAFPVLEAVAEAVPEGAALACPFAPVPEGVTSPVPVALAVAVTPGTTGAVLPAVIAVLPDTSPPSAAPGATSDDVCTARQIPKLSPTATTPLTAPITHTPPDLRVGRSCPVAPHAAPVFAAGTGARLPLAIRCVAVSSVGATAGPMAPKECMLCDCPVPARSSAGAPGRLALPSDATPVSARSAAARSPIVGYRISGRF